MVRAFRAVGTQFAAMFAYDMLQTASRNLGWQTHYLNLVYTPRKAMSAIIAAEAMRRLPRMRSYGGILGTPGSAIPGFRRQQPGELVARDAFFYAGSTQSKPPDLSSLRRIAAMVPLPQSPMKERGFTSSTGCDPACGGWRSIPTRCRCAIHSSRQRGQDRNPRDQRSWPMTIKLPIWATPLQCSR